MRRVRITERCLWEQRGDEDGSPASSPRGTTAKSLASSSRSALPSVADGFARRGTGAAARAAALEAAKARGVFGESPEKPPPRFRTVFVGTPAGTSARDVSEDVVRGAASKSTRVDARRIKRTTRLDGDSDRPAARRLETLARPSVVSASIGRAALRGVREEEVRMVGAGWNAGETRRGWRRRRRRGRGICSTTRRRRGRRDREARGRCSWNSAYRTSRSPPCPCPRGRRTSSGDGGKASDTVPGTLRRSPRRANFCSSCQNRSQSCVDVTVGFSNRTRATTSVFVTSPRRVAPAVSWTGTWPR